MSPRSVVTNAVDDQLCDILYQRRCIFGGDDGYDPCWPDGCLITDTEDSPHLKVAKLTFDDTQDAWAEAILADLKTLGANAVYIGTKSVKDGRFDIAYYCKLPDDWVAIDGGKW